MHFQFWILNSIEIRINELDKRQKKIEKILEGLEDTCFYNMNFFQKTKIKMVK